MIIKKSKPTERELEVLNLIAYEHTTKEIASKLFITPDTVNSHRKNLISKLQVRNTAGLIRTSIERGILPITLNSPL